MKARSACASKALSVAASAAASALALVSTSFGRLARGGRQSPASLPGSVGRRSLRAAASLAGSAAVCRPCSAVGGSGKSAQVAGESSLTAALTAALAAAAWPAGTERATSSPCPRQGSRV